MNPEYFTLKNQFWFAARCRTLKHCYAMIEKRMLQAIEASFESR